MTILTLVALIDHHLEAAIVIADHESGRLRLRQAVLPVVPLQGDDLGHLRGVGQALDVQLGLENEQQGLFWQNVTPPLIGNGT